MTRRLLCPGAALSSFPGLLCPLSPPPRPARPRTLPDPPACKELRAPLAHACPPPPWRPGSGTKAWGCHAPGCRALPLPGPLGRRSWATATLAHALSHTRRTRSYSQLRAAVSAGAERARAHVPTPRGCSSPSPPSRTAVFPGLLGSVALLPPPHFLGGPGENGRGEAHPAPLCCRRVSMEAFGSAWEGETCRRVASPRPSRGRRPFLPFYFEGAGL